MNEADKKERLERLAKLQVEAKEKEGVLFVMYGALLAFSSTALLALTTVPSRGFLTTVACCSLTAACISFGTVVIGKIHVLHKAEGLHIGHIIVAENFSSLAHVLGLVFLTIGIATLVWHISWFCALFFIVCIGFAFHQHARFRKALDVMPDARHALDVVENRQSTVGQGNPI
ncbi:hypothetical protein F6X37_35545 [Paraburkholderia sp. 31.1]|uniref:hypothetical protein n=1 Tax=Paraburkholderia sp. 31.1 TaxID=2615205 RepID=UPI001655372F|nr:hypothetical protein [Paraburkholderia sp. 31.1]MBC8726628.1 hypothetical protein [Paraburkholderia sp. 31.1]